MSNDDDRTELDAQIDAILARADDKAWAALWEAFETLGGETTFATWAGGNVVAATNVNGENRPVHAMPYPVYADSVERVRDALGRLGLFVPFDWTHWEGLVRYRDDPASLATAPVADAVRTLTAIQRSERFSEGSIQGALERGVLQAAVTRLRRWHADGQSGHSH